VSKPSALSPSDVEKQLGPAAWKQLGAVSVSAAPKKVDVVSITWTTDADGLRWLGEVLDLMRTNGESVDYSIETKMRDGITSGL